MAKPRGSVSRARAITGTAFFACALGACNLLAGFESEYTVGTMSAEGGGDVGAGVGEGGASDGSPDAGFDANRDAGPDGRFCEIYGDASGVTYCWDFEEVRSGPSFGWDLFENTYGEAGVENGIGVGGTRGLRATVSNAAGSARVFLIHESEDIDPTFLAYSRHELTFSLAITKKSTLQTCVLGSLGFRDGTATPRYAGISIWRDQDALDISDTPGGAPSGHNVAPGDAGTWHTGTIRYERDGGPTSYYVTVFVDGEKVDGPRAFSATNAGKTQVAVGAFYSSPSGGVEAVIDNVLLRQE